MSEKNCHLIGARLSSERKRIGHSLESFAKMIGVSRRTLQNWESCASYPDASQLLGMDGLIDSRYVLFGMTSCVAQSPRTEYPTPARDLAEKIAAMKLSLEDADLILGIASRLNLSK